MCFLILIYYHSFPRVEYFAILRIVFYLFYIVYTKRKTYRISNTVVVSYVIFSRSALSERLNLTDLTEGNSHLTFGLSIETGNSLFF